MSVPQSFTVEKALGTEGSLPDLILLDLDLGPESGYEILRIRYSSPHLARIPVVIWTQLGLDNYEVCVLFISTAMSQNGKAPPLL
jgi:CheY-like chemotaxis protein